MKMIEKIGIGLAIVIGIIVMGFFSVPWIGGLITKDIPPIDDRDLLLEKVMLLDSDNAYFDLIRGGKELSLTDEEEKFLIAAVQGKTWDDKTAITILEKNTKALAVFSAAARKGKFQNPQLADPFSIEFLDITIPHTNAWRKFARLSAINARFLAQKGMTGEALEEAVTVIRVASSISRSQLTLAEYIVALGMKEIAITTALVVARGTYSDQARMKSMIAELSMSYDNETGLANALKGEYMGTVQITDRLAEGDSESARAVFNFLGDVSDPRKVEELSKKTRSLFYFRPNKTNKIHADMTRSLLLNNTKHCGVLQFSEPDPSWRSPIALFFSDNAIGKILATVGATAVYENLFEKKCQDDLLVGALQTMLALKMYKNDVGTLPPSLTELVPAYLDSVPLDPFDGKPLRYSPSKKILYSIGADLADEGGSEGDDWKKMADPTFSVAF